MEKVFKNIRETISEGLSSVKWIDMDEGQLELFENPPVEYPCALIGFPQARFSGIGENAQIAELTVVVKVGFRVWEKFSASVPLINQSGAFEHFDILKGLVKLLHGLSGENHGPLTRVGMWKNPGVDPKVYEIHFECAYFDFETADEYTTISKPDIEIA